MKVKVVMIVRTEDYGKEEFKKEIEKLIVEIDPDATLLDFDMYEVGKEKKERR